MAERPKAGGSVELSEDVAWLLSDTLELPRFHPKRLEALNTHLRERIMGTLDKIKGKGQEVSVFGPDWCRSHPQEAGKAHADVIVQTYGSTYALPNKYPEENVKMLNDGNLDMYLMHENGRPAGTACMVIGNSGWAELGRAASLGSVGNELIQNLRLLKWLNDPKLSRRVFGLFSTCRTAPDRNIGTEAKPEIMRGGQAVTHIWSLMPECLIGGFGPLYKKHGALEQFAYTMMSNTPTYVPDRIWVLKDEDRNFVNNWLDFYDVEKVALGEEVGESVNSGYTVHYPPLETGLTEYIHGEITIGTDEKSESFVSLEEALLKLKEVQVPFIQVQVPIDQNTENLQGELLEKGFQAFLFTPGYLGRQSPLLWFGKLTPGVKVVPTFWHAEGKPNPFWNSQLDSFASRVARNW